MIWRQDAFHILGWDSGISLVIDALDIGDEPNFGSGAWMLLQTCCQAASSEKSVRISSE